MKFDTRGYVDESDAQIAHGYVIPITFLRLRSLPWRAGEI